MAQATSTSGNSSAPGMIEDRVPGPSGSGDASGDTGHDAIPEDDSNVDELAAWDQEMEEDIASSITGDPLSEYDIEVMTEGEAIAEYLTLVDSVASER